MQTSKEYLHRPINENQFPTILKTYSSMEFCLIFPIQVKWSHLGMYILRHIYTHTAKNSWVLTIRYFGGQQYYFPLRSLIQSSIIICVFYSLL